jgi:hypothetical protein
VEQCTHPNAGAAGPGAQRASASARLELADILRAEGERYRATHRLRPEQHRAMRAIVACRTAALGGQCYRCERCGALTHRYRSCGNRHCPKCQSLAKERWLAARQQELLPVPYFHVVFTLPHALNTLTLANPRALYALLFHAASATLLQFGRNGRWLGAEIAATLVLHTWDQRLGLHPHVHALVSAGGLSPDRRQFLRTRRGFLFPVRALSRVFRGKFLDTLKEAFERTALKLPGELASLADPGTRGPFFQSLRAQPWVVYAKRPFAGPQQVLDYLGHYTHRVALSNARLLAFDAQGVTFRWRDRAHGNQQKILTLPTEQFIGRFLLHVLPKGFVRIRHYGLAANRSKTAKLAAARAALDLPPPATLPSETVDAFVMRVTGIDLTRCPHCQLGRLLLVAIELPLPPSRAPPMHR